MARQLGLKVVMAVSADGYVSRGPGDSMRWTGRKDKQVFKLLTMVGGELGVGSRTAGAMPTMLPGRRLHVLSHSGVTIDGVRRPPFGLGTFYAQFPGAWLIGGQTIVLEALDLGLVDEVHLVRLPVIAFNGPSQRTAAAQADGITPRLHVDPSWTPPLVTGVDDLRVEQWRRHV